MASFAPQIAWYLDRYHEGDGSTAFHGLIQLPADALPELASAFRGASDTRLRAFLLQVIWQIRHESAVPVLSEALHDREPLVWKEAIDGLVVLASPASLNALRSARSRQCATPRETAEYREWLEEAIDQAEAAAQQV
jgi:hypothetical protein